jgi:hypothetical protein
MSGLFAARLFSGRLFAGRLFVGPAAASRPLAQGSIYGPGSDDIASIRQQSRAKRIRTANAAAIALILAAITEEYLQ